jgi:hypothetical protein
MGDHFDIDRIKAVPLPEICERMGIELKRDKKACCPFHDERTPSCQIREDSFVCFGCGAKGDVVKFVMKYQGVEFPGALRWIAENFGITPSSREFLEPPKRRPQAEQRPPQLRGDDVARQSLACLRLLAAPEDCPLWAYAATRGWSQGVLRALATEGSLGADEAGSKLVFSSPWGTKVRHELGSSRSCRWAAGKAKDCVWRMNLITGETGVAHLFEGETDLIGAASVLPFWRTDGLLAIPGASWRPSTYQATFIGAARTVRLAFDDDDAGRAATSAVAEIFRGVRGCKVEVFDWARAGGAGGDIGAMCQNMNQESLIKLLAENWIKI